MSVQILTGWWFAEAKLDNYFHWDLQTWKRNPLNHIPSSKYAFPLVVDVLQNGFYFANKFDIWKAGK